MMLVQCYINGLGRRIRQNDSNDKTENPGVITVDITESVGQFCLCEIVS